MARALVIVESIAKATRIQGMLGSDYIVKPSIGHIRDLPQSAADIPASVKGEKWARLGINVHDHFKPVYVVSSDRKKIVAELRAALKQVDELYLATDEDREGEAIAWHLQEVLSPKVPVKRMVFHEITPAAIAKRSRRPATSTCGSSTPRRDVASSTVSSATRSPRSCGAPSTRPVRPGAFSPSRFDWSASANESVWTSPRRPGST